MYCPKCGTLLTVRQSLSGHIELYCEPGDMPLSPQLREVLEKRYGSGMASTLQSSLLLYSRQLHGGLRWYCPGDRTRLNDHLESPQCGKHLRDLVYTLVELHPHRPVR